MARAMGVTFRPFQQLGAWALIFLCAPPLSARPNGYAAACGGCHYGELEGGSMTPRPNVTAVASALRVAPEDQVGISVTVESTWPDARVAGFLVMSDSGAGVFTPVDEGTGNVGVEEGVVWDYAVGHTAARELSEGTATFEVAWTAPAEVGAYSFDVFGVSSDDGDGVDDPDVNQEANDSFSQFQLTIGVGCELVTYYYDGDADGYGGEEMVGCEPPAGYVQQGGDCNDDDALVNPGATELCSFVDEDCDGESMAPPTFYRDVDGDGYGEVSDIIVDTCELPAGYAAKSGDCAPTDPNMHPDAQELPGNAADDDCDGMTDEPETSTAVEPLPSVSNPPPSAAASTAPVASQPPLTMEPTQDDGAPGCSVARRRSSAGSALGLLLVCVGLVRRRRLSFPAR